MGIFDKFKGKKSDECMEQGNVLFNLGRDEESLVCYDKALEIDPNNVNAWNNKGDALFDLGRYEESLVCYDKALEIDPNNVDVWGSKGDALGRLGRYEEN